MTEKTGGVNSQISLLPTGTEKSEESNFEKMDESFRLENVNILLKEIKVNVLKVAFLLILNESSRLVSPVYLTFALCYMELRTGRPVLSPFLIITYEIDLIYQ
jgi:hypothetical protein